MQHTGYPCRAQEHASRKEEAAWQNADRVGAQTQKAPDSSLDRQDKAMGQ